MNERPTVSMERLLSDISVAENGDIRYTGAGGRYDVRDLQRLLMNLFKRKEPTERHQISQASNVPIEFVTSNIFSLLDTYNIDDKLAYHLYGGSILQDSMKTHYAGLAVYANAGPSYAHQFGFMSPPGPPRIMEPERTQFQVVIGKEVQTFFGTGDPEGNPDIFARILVPIPGDTCTARIQKHFTDKPYDCCEITMVYGENTATLCYFPLSMRGSKI